MPIQLHAEATSALIDRDNSPCEPVQLRPRLKVVHADAATDLVSARAQRHAIRERLRVARDGPRDSYGTGRGCGNKDNHLLEYYSSVQRAANTTLSLSDAIGCVVVDDETYHVVVP